MMASYPCNNACYYYFHSKHNPPLSFSVRTTATLTSFGCDPTTRGKKDSNLRSALTRCGVAIGISTECGHHPPFCLRLLPQILEIRTFAYSAHIAFGYRPSLHDWADIKVRIHKSPYLRLSPFRNGNGFTCYPMKILCLQVTISSYQHKDRSTTVLALYALG